MAKLRGAFTALITPMFADGSVDYEGFRSLIRFQLKKGIDGFWNDMNEPAIFYSKDRLNSLASDIDNYAQKGITTDNIATDILFDTSVASIPAGTVTTETILAIDCCE